MSSDDETPDDETPPRVRIRTRGTPASGTPPPDETRARTRTRVREHRRALNLSGETPPAQPRDVMDPGPMVDWPDAPRDPNTGEPTPEQIRSRVRTLHNLDPRAAKEFILETLHMMLLQHRPMDDIAKVFGVTTRTVWNWRAKLRERISEDFRARLPTDLAAEQIANLKRTKAYAWQQASRCTEALDKFRWINTTIKCEQELANLYERMKMYKAVEPRREVNEHEDKGVANLVGLVEGWAVGGYAGAQEVKANKGKKPAPDSDLPLDSDLVPPEYDEDDIHQMF